MTVIDDERRREVQAILEEEPPGPITTRRIIIGLAVLVVIVIVGARWALRETYELQEVPPKLVGFWTCDDPERSDWYVDFARHSVTFGTGGTSRLKCDVLGLNSEERGGVGHFTVLYRDMARRKNITEVLLEASGTEIRFTDEPGVIWKKYQD